MQFRFLMLQLSRHLVFFLVLKSICSFAVSQTEVYSESAFYSSQSLFWNTLSARTYPVQKWNLSPYFSLGSEQAIGSDSVGYIYCAPGLNWSYNKLRLFGESRFRSDVGESPYDFRILLTVADYQDSPLSTQNRLYTFWEPYSEVLYTSRDSDNVIFRGFSRMGLRYKFTSSTFTDFFLEPTVAVDRVGHFYNNHLDFKPSLRAGHCYGGICISISATRLFPQYLEGFIRDSSWTSEEGFRFLAAIGGPL